MQVFAHRHRFGMEKPERQKDAWIYKSRIVISETERDGKHEAGSSIMKCRYGCDGSQRTGEEAKCAASFGCPKQTPASHEPNRT